MKRALLFLCLSSLAGCQCVRLEDYRVCDATVDCDDAPDASIDDAGTRDGGATDAGGVDGGCMPDGLIDAVDPSGLDTDCDGIDGVKTRQLYVDGIRGDDPNAVPGDPEHPFKSIRAAMLFASSQDAGTYDAMLVTSGLYDETDVVVWTAQLDVWGGRSGTGSWAPTGSMSNLRSATQVALLVRQVEGRTLRGFQVRASAGPAVSVAVVSQDSSVRFVDVQLYGGAGGDGLTGMTANYPDAGPGLPGLPGVSGLFSQTPAPAGVCGGDPGFGGGAAAKSSSTEGAAGDGPRGGDGGAPPSPACDMPSFQAVAGGDGDAGSDGTVGASATAFGMLGGLGAQAGKLAWVGAEGGEGTAGAPGKPGSGGGGGGSSNLSNFSDASSGGSGGSGGCPGGRGTGGTSGGPSIGLVVRGGRAFIGPDTFVISGAGGTGGTGGPGEMGRPGGAGGASGPSPATLECATYPYGIGAPGGRGGAGGNGGRGGGGAGGHSFAIYCDLDGGFDLDGGTLMPGTPGSGANGARAGVAVAAQGCAP